MMVPIHLTAMVAVMMGSNEYPNHTHSRPLIHMKYELVASMELYERSESETDHSQRLSFLVHVTTSHWLCVVMVICKVKKSVMMEM